jgi:hypothetical protein
MREEGRYGESNAGGDKRKYEVTIEIHKARHEKEGGETKNIKAPIPSNNLSRQKYLQYKRSRSRMTWPPVT